MSYKSSLYIFGVSASSIYVLQYPGQLFTTACQLMLEYPRQCFYSCVWHPCWAGWKSWDWTGVSLFTPPPLWLVWACSQRGDFRVVIPFTWWLDSLGKKVPGDQGRSYKIHLGGFLNSTKYSDAQTSQPRMASHGLFFPLVSQGSVQNVTT